MKQKTCQWFAIRYLLSQRVNGRHADSRRRLSIYGRSELRLLLSLQLLCWCCLPIDTALGHWTNGQRGETHLLWKPDSHLPAVARQLTSEGEPIYPRQTEVPKERLQRIKLLCWYCASEKTRSWKPLHGPVLDLAVYLCWTQGMSFDCASLAGAFMEVRTALL